MGVTGYEDQMEAYKCTVNTGNNNRKNKSHLSIYYYQAVY